METTHDRYIAAPVLPVHAGVLRALTMSWFLLGGLITTGLLGPNRSSVEQAYGLSHAVFGLAVAAIQIAASGGVLLISGWLRRFNHARVLLAGLGLQAAGLYLIWLAQGLAALAVGWALIIVGGVLGSLFNNVSMDLWPRNPRRGVLLLHAFNGIGKVLGPALVGAVLVLGWQTGFFIVGLLTSAVFLAFAAAQGPLQSLARDETKAPGGESNLAALRRPFYWACVLPFGLIAGGEAIVATLLPVYLEHVRGMGRSMASYMLAVHLAGLVFGRFASARLSRVVSNHAIIGLCLAGGLFVLPVVLVDNRVVLVVSLFGLGVQFSSTWPTFYAQVAPFLRDHRDLLAYGSTLCTQAGISLCILFSSAIADASLPLALVSGPATLGLFGAIYFTSRLSAGRG